MRASFLSVGERSSVEKEETGMNPGVSHRNWRYWCKLVIVGIRGTQPCNTKTRDICWRRYKIKDTRNIVHKTMTPQFPSKQAPWDLTQVSQSPSAALSYFPESLQWSEISSLSKVNLVLGRAKSCRAPNLGCREAESPGWFAVLQKNCTRRDASAGTLSWWSCPSPVTCNCGLLSNPNTFHGGMFKLNAKFDANSWLYSLNHFECDGHTVHMLTQWYLIIPTTSTVRSSLFTHVHSSLFSLAARLLRYRSNHPHYINNGWTFSRQTVYF